MAIWAGKRGSCFEPHPQAAWASSACRSLFTSTRTGHGLWVDAPPAELSATGAVVSWLYGKRHTAVPGGHRRQAVPAALTEVRSKIPGADMAAVSVEKDRGGEPHKRVLSFCSGKRFGPLGGSDMAKYVLSWKLRLGGTAQQNHDDGERLIATFQKWQPAADQTFLQF